MLKTKHLVCNLTVVFMLLGMVTAALALQEGSRTSQGNNIGFRFVRSSTVLCASGHEYPRGSGNVFNTHEGALGHFISVVRDIDGDGTMEDTSYGRGRGRVVGGNRASIESMDLVLEGYNSGQRMDQWMGRVENNEVWSSMDPDNVSRWPAEFREGRTEAGEPIFHGVETIAAMHSDVWNRSYHRSVPPPGVSFEYRFHFLNYAESNDIAYGHLFMRNVSEYLKYNDNPDFVQQVANTQDGQMWGELALIFTDNEFSIGLQGRPSGEGWIFHPEKGIKGGVDLDGLENGYTNGGQTFVWGHVSLRNPSFNGEPTYLCNVNHHRWGAEFGFENWIDIGTATQTNWVHEWATAVQNNQQVNGDNYWWFNGELSPWTNRPAIGHPGMLLPSDDRYDQWLWGTRGQINYVSYAPIRNFGPRDSTSTDFALMFTYASNAPLVFPSPAIENIDEPTIQEGLVPLEQMADVAKIVYEGNYVVPATPEPPELTIIPGDRQVTITWSNVNLNTPDPYYYFVQEHPELDPQGRYREYDFEGYRLYRNYTGPSDAHAEMIWEGNLTDDNIQFYYIDKREDDEPYYRMRNGVKVWYALVPYDRNWDNAEQEYFSLPDPEQSKTWNKPFPEGYHTVRPRSNASNYIDPQLDSYTFVPASGASFSTLDKVELSGDGSGKLTEPPIYMAPAVSEFEVVPVTGERVTTDKNISVVASSVDWYYAGCNRPGGTVRLQVAEGGQTGRESSELMAGGDDQQTLDVMGPVDGEGIAYTMNITFEHVRNNRSYRGLYYDIDLGGYGGATVTPKRGGCGGRSVGGDPGIAAFTRTGVFTVEWKDAGNGELTVEVTEALHGRTVPYTQIPEAQNGQGWGFWTDDNNRYRTYYFYPFRDNVPLEDRELLQAETIPADRTDNFVLYLNGLPWEFTGIESLPAPGTVWTITNAFGEWNGDQTVFTQYPDIPWIGDKWDVNIAAMDISMENADLKQIRVVPNPYIADSMLDMNDGDRRIEFINLPTECTIRIYTLGGNLVNVLNHIGANRFGWGDYTNQDHLKTDNSPFEFHGYDNHGGTEPWNLKNRFGQTVATGLYFYHVTDSRGETYTGKFYVVN